MKVKTGQKIKTLADIKAFHIENDFSPFVVPIGSIGTVIKCGREINEEKAKQWGNPFAVRFTEGVVLFWEDGPAESFNIEIVK